MSFAAELIRGDITALKTRWKEYNTPESVKFAGVLKRIYDDFDVEDLNQRRNMHKVVFLMQRIVTQDSGFRFSLDFQGPYSGALAGALWHLPELSSVLARRYVDPELEERFQVLLDGLNGTSFTGKVRKNDQTWLECACGIINNRQTRFPDAFIERVRKDLVELKWISSDQTPTRPVSRVKN